MNPSPLLIYFTFFFLVFLSSSHLSIKVLKANLGHCDVYERFVHQWHGGICTSDVFPVISAVDTMTAAPFYMQNVVLKTL